MRINARPPRNACGCRLGFPVPVFTSPLRRRSISTSRFYAHPAYWKGLANRFLPEGTVLDVILLALGLGSFLLLAAYAAGCERV